MTAETIVEIIVVLAMIALIISSIIVNASRSKAEKEEKLARIDHLTGIPNAKGEVDIVNLVEKHVVGMFLILDLDHFSDLNDQYGKDAGDKVLVSVANCMVDVFRSSDIILRLEDDRFAVYCPRVKSREVGEDVLNRFLDRIAQIKLKEIDNEPIRMSVGASFYAGQEEIVYGDLYDKANERCEESKAAGGGCYVLADFLGAEESESQSVEISEE